MNNFKIYVASAISLAKLYPSYLNKNPIYKSVLQYNLNPKRIITVPYYLAEIFATIAPTNPTLTNYVLGMSEQIGKHIDHNLNIDDYVHLTRFYSENGADRINCDWCSVVNGFNEFFMDSLKGNSATNILKTRTILFSIVHTAGSTLSYVPFSTFHGYKKVSATDAIKFIKDNDISCKPLERIPLIVYIRKLLDFKNIVERVEERWCPFGYIQDIAYERNYWGTEIEAQCNEIRKHGRVKCDFCVVEMNKATPKDKEIKPSVYTKYMEHVRKSVKKK